MLRPHLAEAPPPDGAPRTVADDIAHTRATLAASCDVDAVTEVTDRKVLGPLALGVKRLLRRLLTAVLSRQAAYNRANLGVLAHLERRLDAVSGADGRLRAEALRDVLAPLERGLAQAGERLQQLDAAVHALQVGIEREASGREVALAGAAEQMRLLGEAAESVRTAVGGLAARLVSVEDRVGTSGQGADRAGTLSERTTRLERRYRRLVHLLGGEEAAAVAAPPRTLAEPLEPRFDNLSFEEHFRGPEAEIRERQRVYLQSFQGRSDVLDVGCGRGEFLELLRDAGIPATGVDTDLDVVLACREKGLTVLHRDALDHLRSLPEGSLGGLFAAQVVEHLEAQQIFDLVRLAHRTLQPGAVMILETVNPSCLTVFADSFYLDFTHVRPIHHAALCFLARSAGFGETWVHWSAPVDPALRIPPLPAGQGDAEAVARFDRAIERLNDLLYGYRDYAVLARKTAAPG